MPKTQLKVCVLLLIRCSYCGLTSAYVMIGLAASATSPTSRLNPQLPTSILLIFVSYLLLNIPFILSTLPVNKYS